MTKNEIRAKFTALRPHGFRVDTFQDRRATQKHNGFPDVVITKGNVFFIEIKTRNDKPSKKQLEFKEAVASTPAVFVFATEFNCEHLVGEIVGGTLTKDRAEKYNQLT